jgi:excisionase family DNA binding protein
MSDRLLTIPEVAEITRLSVWTIRRAIDAGELRGIRIRSRVRVSRNDLGAWLDAGSTAPVPTVSRREPAYRRTQPPADSFRARARARHGSRAPR